MEASQKISTPVWPNCYISGYLSEEHGNTNLKRYIHPCVYCTIIIVKILKQHVCVCVCVSVGEWIKM